MISKDGHHLIYVKDNEQLLEVDLKNNMQVNKRVYLPEDTYEVYLLGNGDAIVRAQCDLEDEENIKLDLFSKDKEKSLN